MDNRVQVISPSCQMTIVNNATVEGAYYVQFAYLKLKNTASMFQYISTMSDKIDYPIALQPFKMGHRLLVGPLQEHTVNRAIRQLDKLGINDFIIKYTLFPPTGLSSVAHSLTDSATPKKTAPIWDEIGIIGDRLIVMPRNEDELPLFCTSDKYKRMCNTFGGNARLATYYEYLVILSSLPAASRIGLQYRFWLEDNTTITRVADEIVIQSASGKFEETRPFLCSIQGGRRT